MCFAYDATPPDPPNTGALGADSGTASGEDIVLTAADGIQFAAYVSRPGAPNGAGIVILPDVRGLFRFYKELADRFAVAGVEAIAIDYFGRTAGLTPRDESFDYMPHVQQTQASQVAQDVAAAITYLKGHVVPVPRAIFTVGFCFGGTQSLVQDANHHGLAGVIGFYGPPTTARAGGPSVVDRISEFECPVLAFYGGQDQAIPPEAIQTFEQALTNANVPHEIVVYPDAPHSFFDRRMTEYQADSADAWQRMLAFIGRLTPA
ncbi:MAG TPA: dienelactone hydrolase family protein [Ktedonobacterales bacterium]|nr:dienelactone hydrolase family protein [Ktedonobacterales bacterium]